MDSKVSGKAAGFRAMWKTKTYGFSERMMDPEAPTQCPQQKSFSAARAS
jgi:hypothetical protein